MLSIFKKWAANIKGGKVDWDDLEATLIQSDLGIELSLKLVEQLKKQAVSAETVTETTAAEILKLWDKPEKLPDVNGGPKVWLIIGINGAGKTTSIGKLAHRYIKTGKKVHMVAADTFRAAAIDQLRVWAERSGAGFTAGTEGGDPAAATFQGLEAGLKEGTDLILVDTAGRLHNKENLMRELEKVKRVMDKKIPGAPHETILVLDGTNGANAIQQASSFHKALDLTGLIVTKLDSSSKGGAVAAIKAETNVSPYFVGLGEGLEDLKPFEAKPYVERFF